MSQSRVTSPVSYPSSSKLSTVSDKRRNSNKDPNFSKWISNKKPLRTKLSVIKAFRLSNQWKFRYQNSVVIKTWNIFSTFNLKKCATTLFQVEGGGGVDKLLRADDGIFYKGEYKGYKVMNSKILLSKHVILQQELVIWKNISKKAEIKNISAFKMKHVLLFPLQS